MHLWLERQNIWEVGVEVLSSTKDVQDVNRLRTGDVLQVPVHFLTQDLLHTPMRYRPVEA